MTARHESELADKKRIGATSQGWPVILPRRRGLPERGDLLEAPRIWPTMCDGARPRFWHTPCKGFPHRDRPDNAGV